MFEEDTSWSRLLHNETAFVIQRRLQHNGVPMIVLPVQLDLRLSRGYRPPGALRGRGTLEAEVAPTSAARERCERSVLAARDARATRTRNSHGRVLHSHAHSEDIHHRHKHS